MSDEIVSPHINSGRIQRRRVSIQQRATKRNKVQILRKIRTKSSRTTVHRVAIPANLKSPFQKNRHNTTERTLARKTEMKHRAPWCELEHGVSFSDSTVYNHRKTNIRQLIVVQHDGLVLTMEFHTHHSITVSVEVDCNPGLLWCKQ
jgi:hypothetical protein